MLSVPHSNDSNNAAFVPNFQSIQHTLPKTVVLICSITG